MAAERSSAHGNHQRRLRLERPSATSRACGSTATSDRHTPSARVSMPPTDGGNLRVTNSAFASAAMVLARLGTEHENELVLQAWDDPEHLGAGQEEHPGRAAITQDRRPEVGSRLHDL